MSFDYFYKFSDKILNINIFWNHFQKVSISCKSLVKNDDKGDDFMQYIVKHNKLNNLNNYII